MDRKSRFPKPPGPEWRRCLPAVVWSQCATLTLWSGADSILPLELLERFPNGLATPLGLLSRFLKPPGQECRLCPPAVVWSHWATLTLWSGTDSNFPLETARTLSKWLWASNGPLKPPCKASRSRMASVSSSCHMVALGDADHLECHQFHIAYCPHATAFSNGLPPLLPQKPLSKASRSGMVSAPSSCRMVVHGDADPLGWHRRHFPLEPTLVLSQWSWSATGLPKQPSKSFPVLNGAVALQPLMVALGDADILECPGSFFHLAPARTLSQRTCAPLGRKNHVPKASRS
jgi:hypothetical protein